MTAVILLSLSIILSVGRNLLSKNLAGLKFGTRPFFLCQATLFLCGGIALLTYGGFFAGGVSLTSLTFAAIYGLLLILAQWFYTAALGKGNTALCSTVYSLGFILPTLSGAIFWSETFTLLDAIGIALAASAVVVSGFKKPRGEQKSEKTSYFLPLLVAMLASGGLGIVQKIQQKSEFAYQKSSFLTLAFLLAAVMSLLAAIFVGKRNETRCETGGTRTFSAKKLGIAACVGLFFASCNLLNTSLAGMLDSAIFFPTLNIGVILLSTVCGALLLKERITRRDMLVLLIGSASILLLNIG